ncbi:MAG TPA: NADP-dependent oxidoreductase [Thermoplasmata archaeon]|nr:NADP-dependent oxidoreductase [Thermoplasmata archaeon]HYB79161.1 NADP-dependent oxidoreductase [Thermoplasmata archaeon]
MSGRVNRRWLVAKRFDGQLTEANFRWVESPAPAPGEGQFLVHNLWLSFDPTQIFMLGRSDAVEPNDSGIPLGEVMNCIAVSEVLESRHPGFAPGDIVHGHTAWEDYTVTDGQSFTPTYRVPEGVPANWAVGVLGLTGLVAYFGVHEIARPKPDETLVISGAAGGVGSIASQLAKIYGLRVIGIAGSPAKCEWLLHEAGVDGVINYRTEDVGKRLTELCPDGIDIFFDNDGGPTLDIALDRLRAGGRVVLCGATSRYAAKPQPPGPVNYLALVMVNGRMEGLLGRDYIPRRAEAVDAMLPLLRSGRLKSKEDVLVGLREAPRGLARLYSGDNIGKQLLRMDPAPGN